MPRFFRTIVTSVILASSAHAGVLINELMLRPGTTFPEVTAREYVELHNTDTSPVDISGWVLNSGINFTFPAATIIPAGGFVLVAADPAAANSTYGRNDFLGPWVGGLSNNSERVRLSKPGVTAGTFDRVDEVTYATEGDWARRVRLTSGTASGGWAWQTGATAGFSFEVRNPALSNDNGQNWAVSAALNGTPGVQNSAFVANVAPIIKAVKHLPAVPKSTEPVTISCELNDETSPAGLTAALFWRNATTTSPGGFSAVPMTGDGQGKFSAVLPALANLSIVEFYVSASDGVLTRTWPAPTAEGQNANCQYQVDNEADTATDSYYRLVLTAAENAAYNAVSSSSDREFNQTLISTRSGETTVRYRAGMRIRGNSSRTYGTAKPLRISMPNDDPWDGVTDFNLHIKASYLQFLGLRVMAAAGLPSSNALPVEVRRNGVEYTTSSGSTPDFGKWVRVEPENRAYVARNWPEADTGNLYTKRSPERYWRSSGWTVPTNPDGLLDTWSKQNNSDANDWTDLTNFFTVVQQLASPHFPGAPATDVSQSDGGRLSGTGAWAGTAFTAGQITTLETVADLDHWAKWFAAMTILQDLETNISNGVDDDYGIYFVPDGTGRRRAHFAVHDLDTIFGRGDNQQSASYTDLLDMTEDGQSSYAFRTLLPLFGTTSTPGNAAFLQKYRDAIRSLYGSFLNADTAGNPNPPFYRFVDEHFAAWSSAPGFATEANTIKAFATARQSYLLSLIGQGPLVPPAATSSATLPATPGTIVISEVLARNVAAHANGGAFPDVIELHNTGAVSVDLTGYTLTDDPAVPAKFLIPNGTTIDAGGYLVIYADSASLLPGLHAGFSLNQNGELVELRNGAALVDSVAFGPQASDLSISRTGATLDTWALCTPTIGAANSAPVALAAPGGVRINEWGANPDYLLGGDFIELYNPAAQPVALGEMRISDDPANYPARFTLPALSFVGSGSFLLLDSGSVGLPFGLDSTFGSISFLGANGSLVDRVDVIGQPRDMSQGRSPDGSNTIARFSLPTQPPTPGASNATPPANISNLIAGLRVTEVLFRPNALEFVELQNIGAVALDLSGVAFTEGLTYTFADGTMLAPGAYLVVCKDRTAFVAQYGPAVPLADGVFTGSLDNAGETISLQTPPPYALNILSFAYKTDWFTDPTSDHSFAVARPSATLARDWSEKETWQLSVASLGSPGKDEPPVITSVLSVSATQNQPFSYQITASKPVTLYAATGLPSGLSIETGTGLISGTPDAGGVFNVPISVTANGDTGSATLVISVSVNGPPSFAKGADQTVPIDSGARSVSGWATSISPGPELESAQTVSFIVSADTPALFATQPAVSAAGTLTFTPAAHMSGTSIVSVTAMDNGGTSGGGVDTSGVQTFTITIQPNRAPSFAKGADQLRGDAAAVHTVPGWATAISAGAGETSQTLSFVVTNDNNALFSAQPQVAANGTLTFSLPDANPGEATVTVTAVDNGGTMNSGVDTSAAQTFKITVIGANRPPSFTVGPDVSVRHNVGIHTVVNWATAISPGPGGDATQTVTFEVSNSNTSLFTSQPVISPGGTLAFTPHTARSGTATVTATLRDSGGTVGGGVDFVTKTFTITTRAVNDAPTFSALSALSVGVRSDFSGTLASNIIAGPVDEAAQTVAFLLSNDRPDLFVSQPTLLPSGVLTFTTAGQSGTAVFTFRAKDTGGTADGGVDESAPVQVTVRIASALEAVGTYYALIGPDTGTAKTHDNTGFVKITLGKGGAFSGAIVLGGQKFSLKGKVNDIGQVTFSATGNSKSQIVYKVFVPGNPKPQSAVRVVSLSMVISENPAMSGTIDKPAGSDGPARNIARFRATRPIYNGKTVPVPQTILDPATDKGKYAAAFLALAAPNNGKTATEFPQGDGVGAATVSKTGSVTLKGKLADGTSYSFASAILEGGSMPLYAPLYSSKGSLSGTAFARNLVDSDIDGADFFWTRPAIAKPLHPGWPAGIFVKLTASKLLPKATPLFPLLTSVDADGNAAFDLTDTTIGVKAVNVDAKNKVTVVTAAADKLKASISTSSGVVSGSFVSPTTSKSVKFSGVLLRKAGHATGYFLDGIPGGRVQLAPKP